MNYESELLLSIDAPKRRGAFVSNKVELLLPDLGVTIIWHLKAVIQGTFGDSFLLSLSSSDEIAASGLSYSIQIKVDSEVFTLKKVRTINKKNSSWIRVETEDLISESGKGFSFKEVLKENNLKLDINAKLTVVRVLDLLQRATNFINDICSADLADFTIQIGDKLFKAHTLILSARSPVFRRMLANKECEEYKQSLLKIEDVTKDVFEHFLHFVYTGCLPDLPLIDAFEVLIVADKYGVKELKDLCDKRMVDLLVETDPVHDIFQLAHALNCSKELKIKAFRLVKLSIQNKVLGDDWIGKPESVKKLVNLIKVANETQQEGVTTTKKCKIEN